MTGPLSCVVAPTGRLLEGLGEEVRRAAWFARLGEPLTQTARSQAERYAEGLALGALDIGCVPDWPEAERIAKSPDWSLEWWTREETVRRDLLARAKARHPERALWRSLTELTTEAGDLVHGRAAGAAARMGGAAAASVHVAAGAAAHAVYQLAVARLAHARGSLFESKFRLFAAGHWPLGVVGSRLFLF